MLRVARFLRSYVTHPTPRVTELETAIWVGADSVPCTLYRPVAGATHPGWVALHGITVPGRAHPSLQRFARSLAGSGAAVLVPEIAAWRELRVDPAAADQVIVAAAEQLAGMPGVTRGGVAVVGFSFGATQALATAAWPEAAGAMRGVVGFGGYCDPVRTFVYAFTGEHEWEGRTQYLEPDPYGRWIVTANYLTDIPEFASYSRVAEGARRMAVDAGERGNFAGDPVYDPMKREIRDGLTSAEREVWDVIAPPAGRRPPADEARELGEKVANAAVARHPALDPRPHLPRLRVPTVLAHGYHDQLVPYTETLRLHAELPADVPSHMAISRLFAHTKAAPPLPAHAYPLEMLRYTRLLGRVLDI